MNGHEFSQYGCHAKPTNLPFLCDKKIRVTTDQIPKGQQDVRQLTAIGRSVGWASRAMNTTEICQTRQPWSCDQQSFLTAAVILAFKGILRQIYVGPAVRSCVHSFVGAMSALPAPPWRSTLPVAEETSLVSFGHRVVRDRPVLLRSYQQAVSPSVRAPNHPYSPPIAPPPHPASPRGREEAEFPIQVSFVFLSGRDH